MKANILLGISITLLLLALPASASDYTLGIFGNANEDDTINMQDVTYTELIILEYRDRTELSDAKYDGKINMQDVTQIELVILEKEKELTFVDSADRIVTVKKSVKKIVCCTYQPTEAIRAFNAEDKLVGLSNYIIKSEFFKEFREIPSTGSPNSPDYERILELQPDVVFITKWSKSWEDITDTFEPLGIRVVCFDFLDPDTFVDEVRKTGYILDKKDRAEELIDFYQEFMSTIENRVKELSADDKPKVYYEWKPYYALAGGTAWHRHIVIAGGINVFASEPSIFPQVDPETVIERNPDIIVRLSMGGGSGGGYTKDDTTEHKAIRDEIMSRPELQNVNAVKTGRVYTVGGEFVFQGSPRHFVAIGYLAKWFHPELFEDLDPQAIHQEYLTEFQGLDYDLNEQGVFVYHPEAHPDGN
jgi:iron complex transport system substrate-binding protein